MCTTIIYNDNNKINYLIYREAKIMLTASHDSTFYSDNMLQTSFGQR